MTDQRWTRTRALVGAAVALAIGLCTLSLDATTGVQKTRDLFDEIYERGRPIDATLRTLTATFVETSTSPLLAKPLVARGTVAVERPSRIVLNYTEPDTRRVLIDGNLLLIAWPSRGLRQQQDIGAAQGRVQKYFVGKSPEELRRHFTISAREDTGASTWKVELVPTRKQLREGISRIELSIPQATLLPSSMRLTFPSGDTKLMEFSDIKVNPSLPADLFSRTR